MPRKCTALGSPATVTRSPRSSCCPSCPSTVMKQSVEPCKIWNVHSVLPGNTMQKQEYVSAPVLEEAYAARIYRANLVEEIYM